MARRCLAACGGRTGSAKRLTLADMAAIYKSARDGNVCQNETEDLMMQILLITLALLVATVSHLTGPVPVVFDCSDDAYDYR